jgi:hypothetical protein
MRFGRILYAGATLAALAVALWSPGRDAQAERDAGQTVPRFVVDANWPKPLPGGWVTGEVAGNCVDSQDHVFIVNRRNLTAKELRVGRPAPPVIELDARGNVVSSWGDPTILPEGLHGCFVDHEDNVWIGGNGDAIVQKYSHGGVLLLQVGTKGLFDSSDGTAAGTPTNASTTRLNRPADIAVDPANGDIYIADGYGNRRVAVFDRLGTFLRQWGRQATTAEANAGLGGVFLQQVHGINLGRDGLVYVNDRKGDRIQVFTKLGAFVRNIWIDKGVGIDCEACIGTAWDLAFSPDVRQTFLYNTDGEQESVWTLARESGARLAQFGQPGHMAGEFTFLHTIAVDSKGNLYTAETVDGRRIQKFRFVGGGRQRDVEGNGDGDGDGENVD